MNGLNWIMNPHFYLPTFFGERNSKQIFSSTWAIFDTAPIKVEARIHGEENWMDVTDGSFHIVPESTRDGDGDWFRSFDVRVTSRIHITTRYRMFSEANGICILPAKS